MPIDQSFLISVNCMKSWVNKSLGWGCLCAVGRFPEPGAYPLAAIVSILPCSVTSKTVFKDCPLSPGAKLSLVENYCCPCFKVLLFYQNGSDFVFQDRKTVFLHWTSEGQWPHFQNQSREPASSPVSLLSCPIASGWITASVLASCLFIKIIEDLTPKAHWGLSEIICVNWLLYLSAWVLLITALWARLLAPIQKDLFGVQAQQWSNSVLSPPVGSQPWLLGYPDKDTWNSFLLRTGQICYKLREWGLTSPEW